MLQKEKINYDKTAIQSFIADINNITNQIEQEVKKGKYTSYDDLYILLQFFYSDRFYNLLENISEQIDKNRFLQKENFF